MYRPSIKSNWTIMGLAVVSVVLYVISENSRVEVKAPYYNEKIEASVLMRNALEAIRDNRAAKVILDEKLGDPLVVTMTGQKYSLITTEEGLLASKMTALNPNFAAVVVDMLSEAGVKKGDKIAIGMTGSFPGFNLAVLSACKVLGLEPVIISSLGSSSWGANEEDFTWLDVEALLREKDIFPYKSIAASIGGGNDEGFGLSDSGRAVLLNTIAKYEIPLIHEASLDKSIDKRMEYYGDVKKYKAYINIGGGIASLGHLANEQIVEPGFNYRLEPRNYPGLGVMHRFGYDTPVINLAHVTRLRARYDLPQAPNPLPPIGIGKVFTETRYDLKIAIISLVIIALMLAAVFRLDKQVFRLAEKGEEPDALL